MQKGFLSIVAAVDDLQIDVPDAPDLVASFVARAVVDDILPPAFVNKLPPGTPLPIAHSCTVLLLRAPNRHRLPCLWKRHAAISAEVSKPQKQLG